MVASSFGGIIALRLAVTRPDLVRSLALHEPPLFSLVAGDPAAAGPLAELFVETIALGPGSWAMIPEPVRALVAANANTFEDELQDPEWANNVDLAGAATRRVFTGMGHAPHLTHTEEYVRAIEEFLA